MKFTIPSRNPFSRLLTVLLGIVILLWSGIEDKDVITVTALGLLLSILTVMLGLMSRLGGRTLGAAALLKLAALVGSAVAALSSTMTVLLMLFKDLRHGHVYPDYPPPLMLGILERLPLWSLAGGLAGLGLGFLALWTAGLRRRHLTDAGDIHSAD